MGGDKVGLLDVKLGDVKKDCCWWVRSCGDIFRSAVKRCIFCCCCWGSGLMGGGGGRIALT